MLLEIEDLQVDYGKVRALSNVSLFAHEGEALSVIGANGAGKSSLLQALMGLAPITRGTIKFRGQDIRRWPAPRRVRAGIALVPEGRRIFIALTVEENLLIGAYQRRDRAAILADLEQIYETFPRLAARRAMSASVLSGGEQQMLAIGRALMARPSLMLFDEPSLGLSPLIILEVFKLIQKLNEQKITVLLVEQNTRLALRFSTRGYVLKLGSVVATGSSADLGRSPDLAAFYLDDGISKGFSPSCTASYSPEIRQ